MNKSQFTQNTIKEIVKEIWQAGFFNHPEGQQVGFDKISSKLEEAQKKGREEGLEEARKVLWNGATRDEVHLELMSNYLNQKRNEIIGNTLKNK